MDPLCLEGLDFNGRHVIYAGTGLMFGEGLTCSMQKTCSALAD